MSGLQSGAASSRRYDIDPDPGLREYGNRAPTRDAARRTDAGQGGRQAALGWTPGSFATVLDGAEPTLRNGTEYPLSGTTKVLVEQLTQIAQEARAGAAAADTLSKRLQVIGDIAESAAQLAARTR